MVEVANALAGEPRPAPELDPHAGRRASARTPTFVAPLARPAAAAPGPSSTSACCSPARHRRDAPADRSRAHGTSATSASRRRAAGAACRPRSSRAARAHAEHSRPVADPAGGGTTSSRGRRASPRIPAEDWVEQPVDVVRAPLRHGREPRLVPQPRPDGRAACAGPRGRADPDRLLGRHRDPARPPAAARVRPADRDGDRRQLAEVPARRARTLPRRRARRVPPARASSGTRSGSRPGRGARRGLPGRGRCSSRRTRSTSTTSSTGRSPPGRASSSRAAACGSTPATCATRARGENEWIIDETVYVVHEVATGLVRTDPRWAAYRDVLDDAGAHGRVPRLARPRLPRAAAARATTWTRSAAQASRSMR